MTQEGPLTMKALLIIALTAAAFQVAAFQPQSPAGPAANTVPREHGRQLFTEKCGKCHDETARKKLSDGSTLLTRLSARKDWQALLGTRLKSMSLDDRQAVTLYLEGLLSEFQSSD